MLIIVQKCTRIHTYNFVVFKDSKVLKCIAERNGLIIGWDFPTREIPGEDKIMVMAAYHFIRLNGELLKFVLITICILNEQGKEKEKGVLNN